MIDTKSWFCDNIKKLENGMYRFSYSILRNEEDVEDAVQETICRAYRELDNLKDKNKFKPWIYIILKNTSFQILNNKKYCCNIEDENIQANKTDVETGLTIWNAVQRLDNPYRTVITLFYYEDLPIKEISKITGSKVDAVRKQLSRGREKIKEIIER